jgi:hypothetical protein
MPELSTPQNLIVYAAAAVLACLVLYLGVRWSQSRREVDTREVEAERERAKNEASARVRQGTHDAQGHRLCITCNDKFTRATQRPFVIEEDSGIWDLIRRSFGAPARYSVKQLDRGADVYCESCAVVVRAKHERKILEPEIKLRDLHFETALSFRRWVQHGVNDVVAAQIEQHDEREQTLATPTRRATVTQLRSEANGGG